MDVVACGWWQYPVTIGISLLTLLAVGLVCFMLDENTNFFTWLNPVERVKLRIVRRAWQRKEAERAASAKSRHK